MKIIMVRTAPKRAVVVDVPQGWIVRELDDPVYFWIETPDGEGGRFNRDAIMDAVAEGETLEQFYSRAF